MKNPFVYGETVSGENFCNRTREIKELVADIINCQNVIIFSPRRYGKTSLIKKVLDKIKRKGILTFYVDLYPAINKTKFIEIYAGAISNGLPGGVRQVAKKIREYLPRIIPKVVMDGQSVHFEFEFDRISNISSNIDDILVAAKKVADQKKKTAVVVFDEFQEIANLDDDEIERKMRSVFQNHRNVSYIFMGSKTHLMRDIFNNPNRPFYKSGKHFPLDKIDPKELNLFAKRKFLDQAIVIGHNELNSILNNTECHPYYFQMLCHVLWELCMESGKITEADIDEALNILISRESSVYIAVWEELTIKQKNLMVALAKEEYPEVFSRKFLETYGLGPSSSIQKALKKLLKKELVHQENGSYVIYDLFFKKWIRHTW
ncbi:MAG: ATP-binding protein [Deltaproteobacteria bacterium]|nr:ATP-binding protein [Deltaproteobacteria bacterium]